MRMATTRWSNSNRAWLVVAVVGNLVAMAMPGIAPLVLIVIVIMADLGVFVMSVIAGHAVLQG